MKHSIIFLSCLFGISLGVGYDGIYPTHYGYPYMRGDFGRMGVTKTAVPSPAIPDELLRTTMKMQSTQVAEITLNRHNNKGCFMRTVCAVGTLNMEQTPKFSMAQGILEFRRLLEEMIEQVNANNGMKQEDFPNIHKTLASFEVGSSTKDLELCEQLFPCRASTAENLITDALAAPEKSLREGRTTCVAAGNLCPGVSIGCALCGIFLDSTCSAQCTIAGLYCGVSGYACKAEAEEAIKNAVKKLANDEEKQKEFMKFMFGDLADHMQPKLFDK